MGRQAVVEDCSEVLDEQIAIINETLSKVVAWHAEDYLRDAALEMGTDSYYHSVSEAWGFVYSLQFTKMSDGTPLFTHAEVMNMITDMENGDGSGNGAYGLDATTLNDMADQIATAVGAY